MKAKSLEASKYNRITTTGSLHTELASTILLIFGVLWFRSQNLSILECIYTYRQKETKNK